MAYVIIQQKCDSSGQCIKECPMEAISIDKTTQQFRIDPDLCTDCGSCADVCPKGAITGADDET